MKRSLGRAFHPPAPLLPTRVRRPGGVDEVLVDGKLDTGADLCGVPEALIEELGLFPTREARAAGFNAALAPVLIYRIDLELGDLAFEAIEAVVIRRPYVLVGRNVLQHLVMRIDGPRELLELRRPAAPRARR